MRVSDISKYICGSLYRMVSTNNFFRYVLMLSVCDVLITKTLLESSSKGTTPSGNIFPSPSVLVVIVCIVRVSLTNDTSILCSLEISFIRNESIGP